MQRRALLRARNTPRPASGAALGSLQVMSRDVAVPGSDRKSTTRFSGGDVERPFTPRRAPRQQQLRHEIGLNLRQEERDLIQEIGRFRVVAIRDAAEFLYGGSEPKLRRDLAYLSEQGLVQAHVLNARRDGRLQDAKRFEALTLTRRGRKLLEKSGELPHDQRVYSGIVKPREAEHDSQIFRAYQKELVAIERQGGRNPRARLDFELKAKFNRAVYTAQKAEPERDKQEIKLAIAGDYQLTVEGGRVVIPDLRIDYDLPSGSSAHVDVEVATAAYRQGHFAAKARAGFKIYVPNNDIGRLGAAVRDDHDIMSEILSL
jgi:hypothetical protein